MFIDQLCINTLQSLTHVTIHLHRDHWIYLTATQQRSVAKKHGQNRNWRLILSGILIILAFNHRHCRYTHTQACGGCTIGAATGAAAGGSCCWGCCCCSWGASICLQWTWLNKRSLITCDMRPWRTSIVVLHLRFNDLKKKKNSSPFKSKSTL